MKQEITEKITELESPTDTFNTMRLNQVIKVPNTQRTSINSTIQRFKDISNRKFKCKRFETYFTVKRIK